MQWLWWDDSFDFEETTIHGAGNQDQELRRYVESIRPYPAWQLAVDRQKDLVRRAFGKLGRSEGCFALSQISLQYVLQKLGPGRMLYADKV